MYKQNRFNGDYISCIIRIKLYDSTQFKSEILTVLKNTMCIKYTGEKAYKSRESIQLEHEDI